MTQRPHQQTDSPSPASWAFSEDFVPLTEPLTTSRQVSVELGLEAPSPGTLSTLRVLARMLDARAVVEVGTGSGATGLAAFSGMNRDGILTSIDSEPQRQAEARSAFLGAGVRSQRFRLIAGAPLEVLPKLRDGAYDIVMVNGDKLEYVEYVAQALRLLRHGGVLVLNDALWHDGVADARNEDDETVIIREALLSVQQTEEFTATLLPVGNGLLVAVKD